MPLDLEAIERRRRRAAYVLMRAGLSVSDLSHTQSTLDDQYALIEEVRRLREEGRALKLMVVDMYYSGHRDGWMPGESTSETMDRAHDLLCNLGLDPYTNGGPEAIKKLREQNQ